MGYIKLNQALAALVLLSVTSAYAECGVENRVVLTCPIENKDARLTICLKQGLPDPTVAYEYARTDEDGFKTDVELFIERDVRDVHYGYWTAKGPDQNIEFAFDRGEYSYKINMTNENYAELTAELRGEVTVSKSDEVISELSCEKGRAEADGYGLILDQIYALGYEWCGGFGAFGFDEMRYINCAPMEIGFDQVTGEAEPKD